MNDVVSWLALGVAGFALYKFLEQRTGPTGEGDGGDQSSPTPGEWSYRWTQGTDYKDRKSIVCVASRMLNPNLSPFLFHGNVQTAAVEASNCEDKTIPIGTRAEHLTNTEYGNLAAWLKARKYTYVVTGEIEDWTIEVGFRR